MLSERPLGCEAISFHLFFMNDASSSFSGHRTRVWFSIPARFDFLAEFVRVLVKRDQIREVIAVAEETMPRLGFSF
jgi:hypothetical protein